MQCSVTVFEACRKSSRWTCCLLLAWGACASSAQAHPTLEQMAPPVVQRGATTRITLQGQELSRAQGVWTSLPGDAPQGTIVGGGDARNDDQQVQIDLAIPPTAPLGIYGLRLATENGLSNVHLFAVDSLPLLQASQLDPAVPLALPVSVWGPCRPSAIERFPIDVQAGQRLSFESLASRLGQDEDPLITIRDARGKRVARHDNDPGLFFDFRFEHTFAAAGRYFVELSDARYHGDPNHHYVLRVGDFPAARVALPGSVARGVPETLAFPQMPELKTLVSLPNDFSERAFFQEIRNGEWVSSWVLLQTSDLPNCLEIEPNDTPDHATPAAAPCNLHGCLQSPGDQDWFALELAQGQKLEFRAQARSLGSAADLELALVEASSGRELQRIDDVQLDEAAFRFTAPTAGTFRFLVRDMARDGGPAFTYRVEVRPDVPRFEVTAVDAAWTVPLGSYQPIALTVTRTDFTGPIALSLANAPASMRLRPDFIPDGVNEFVCNLWADPTTPPGLYTPRMIAADANKFSLAPATVVQVQPLVDKQLINVDLIKLALREDQRRLPPSLVDRMAVQVVGAAPFELELAEASVTLARYQSVPIGVQARRSAGFEAPIRFSARGGQLGEEQELRTQIFATLPDDTPGQPLVTGMLKTRNLVRAGKQRVFVDATAAVEGHQVTLTRTFELDVRPAFDVKLEKTQLEMAPGGSANFKLLVVRLPSFQGPIEFHPLEVKGFSWDVPLLVREGRDSLDLTLRASNDVKPGNYRLRWPASAKVESFVEEIPGVELEVVVK